MRAHSAAPQPARPLGRLIREPDVLLALAAYAVTLLIFAPTLLWLAGQLRHEQLHLPVIILVLAGFFIVLDHRRRLRWRFKHDRVSLGFLAGVYAVFVLLGLGGGWLRGHGLGWVSALIVFLGLGLLLGSGVRYCLGARAFRLAAGPLVGFFLFIALVLFLERLDWPLRNLAGIYSAWALNILGVSSDLYLVAEPRPMFLLDSEAGRFNVAQECNGFGLLGGALMLTVLLGIYRRVGWFNGVLLLVGAGAFAFSVNVLRIVIIVVLAPVVGMGNYDLMHEVVGLLTFYGALALLYWFIVGFGRDPRPPPPSAAGSEAGETSSSQARVRAG